MVDRRYDPIGKRPSQVATNYDVRGPREVDGPDGDPVHRATKRTEWADELTTLLRTEIDCASTRGLINVAESEELFARLVILIDQALAAR